jgi:hypothetical protein
VTFLSLVDCGCKTPPFSQNDSKLVQFFFSPTKLQDSTKQKTTLVRQDAFLIRVEEIEDVSSKFYVISVITKMLVEEAEGKR